MWWVTALLVVSAFALGRLSVGRRAVDISVHPINSATTVSTQPSVDEVLDELHLGIAISGPDGRGEFRNAAARAMAGTHAGVLIDDAVQRHLARGLVGIRSDEVIELYGPPAAVFVVRSAPLPSGGSVSFVEDISERRRIDRMRTDFVANVSHELKTPVGALSVLAETLQGEHDLATVQRLAGRMMAEAERADNTIDDLIELSRIEIGGERNVLPVSVGDLVAGAVDRVRELAMSKDIAITAFDAVAVEGRRSDLLIVNGDRPQLVSALGNLVENAVKYSEHGGTVHVRVRRSGEWAEITVTDRGVGIPANDVDRIFERFYRVDRARSRDTGGSGLGLSIVRHVATHHDGEIVVSSVEGQGSTFTLRLPIADGDRDGGDPRVDHDEGVA